MSQPRNAGHCVHRSERNAVHCSGQQYRDIEGGASSVSANPRRRAHRVTRLARSSDRSLQSWHSGVLLSPAPHAAITENRDGTMPHQPSPAGPCDTPADPQCPPAAKKRAVDPASEDSASSCDDVFETDQVAFTPVMYEKNRRHSGCVSNDSRRMLILESQP